MVLLKQEAITFLFQKVLSEKSGVQVILDSDLADLFTTETMFIYRAVKRNINRFPDEFMFALTEDEWEILRFQFGTSSTQHGGRRNFPTAFTEQGIAMLSSVLHTDVAVRVSIQIMQAFVAMRRALGQLRGVIQRLEGLEVKQFLTDQKLDHVYKALESQVVPKQGIFFEGQLFDALVFASDLVKLARSSIELVDNYVDEGETQQAISSHRTNRKPRKSRPLSHHRRYPTLSLRSIVKGYWC